MDGKREKAETARKIDFAATRDEGLAHLDEIIPNYETEIALPHEDFKKYLSENISYSIDEKMQKGLSLYYDLAHKQRFDRKQERFKIYQKIGKGEFCKTAFPIFVERI